MASKFALVIANTEYQDASFAKLTAPGKDAEEFAQVLRDTKCAAFDDVQVLLNEGEGRTRRSIARFFAERKRDDLLLLYFSGHGVRNQQGQLFLAANDTEIGILEASGIPAEFITNSMNNSRSQRQLLILDCCNSGAFAHGSKSASGVGKSMGIATAFEGSGFGRVVLTATDATQYAWEGDQVIGNTQKSVFTHFLIEGLKGEADRDGDGRIHVDELYDYAYEQIVTRTPKQTPGKWSYKQQGDLILRENLKPREIKPAPLPPELLEMLAHSNSGVRRAGLQELIGLLDGKHQGLARASQEKLREIAENDDSLSLRRAANEALTAHGWLMEPSASIEIKKDEPQKETMVEQPTLIPYEVSKEANRAEKIIEKSVAKLAYSPESPKLSAEKKIKPNFSYSLLAGIVGGVIVFALCLWGGARLLNLIPNVPTTELARTSTPTVGIVSYSVSVKDGMILLYVPAGEFTMGSDEGDDDEKPVHTVYLDAFWIDQTEVTNKMYSLCVGAGVCEEPTIASSHTHSSYYGNSEFDDYPVIYVDWNMAKTYCEWADRRLPTEAEWEKAARGENANVYPWGNTFDGSLVNFCDMNCSFSHADNSSDDGFADIAPVGSYPNGASVYGALNMAGNVMEWMNDWYSETYYSSSPSSNPEGPYSGPGRVVRGGSWIMLGDYVSSANRESNDPTDFVSNLGFRCAKSADGQAESNTTQPVTTAANTPSSVLGIGSTMTGNDGMTLLYVPAGEFTMGGEDGSSNEKPIHTATLNAFWIDQTEVTNAMYTMCVLADQCGLPGTLSSYTRHDYYGISEFDNYPVIKVSWENAKSYCEWADRRLPTESEWEKAARGENANVYPWGNEIPNNELLNYNSAVGDTTEVGTYPDGASVYGALDMAGNVWEWVADWYTLGPDSGPIHVLRGGSWQGNNNLVSSSYALRISDADTPDYAGIRCAMDAIP